MTLKEVRTLLRFCEAPDKNCAGVSALLDEHIGHVALRIVELKQLQKQLRTLRRLCGKTQTVKDCGIVKQLSTDTQPSERRTGHVHGTHSTHRH